MAERTLNTRILLKYDTYANWTANNPVLKAGEVAIATIETNSDGVQNAPSVVVKVGDGTNAYNSLKFISGLAADVYSWAKASTKPSYTADEISGLSDYIAGEIEDTDTQYQIIAGSDDYTYILQSKASGASSWTNVSTITIPEYDDSEVTADIAALETLVGTTSVATQIANAIGALDVSDTAVSGQYVSSVSETDGKISVTRAALPDYSTTYDAYGAADAVQSNVDTLADTVSTLVGSDTGMSIRDISAEEVAEIVAGADTSYDTLKEIADWISSHADSAASMNSQIVTNAANITDNATAISALDSSLATIAKTGNVNDLIQTSGDVLIFDCGDSNI